MKTAIVANKNYVQFKDKEKSIINLAELNDQTRRIWQSNSGGNPVIAIGYQSGVAMYLAYDNAVDRDSDMRRMTYLLRVRKAPGRPKTVSN